MSLFDFIYKQKDINQLKKEIKELKKVNKEQLQALNEGGHDDILNPSITNRGAVEATQKKSMYKTYPAIVQGINRMYAAMLDYGGEFIKSILRTRVAFIAGGGVTVISGKSKTAKWITDFLKHNKMLEGSNLFKNVMRTEKAGKVLLVIKPNKDKTKIDVRSFSHLKNPYLVKMDEKDNQIIKEVVYKSENENVKKGEAVAKLDRLVYIKTGDGDESGDPINEPVPTIGNCLTDIENASRIKYDLRYNNHLFGRLTPVFKTNDMVETKALKNLLDATNWEIGKSYVGTADLKLVGPPSEATDALLKELISACRIISLNTGIPVHWLSYPDLMSNRATAENMMEMVNAATIMEREIWEEGLTELIQKAMAMSVELGIKGYVNDPDNFEIKIPLISESKMKEIQDTWIPLADGGYITKDSVRNKIPGINPLFEKQMIENEKEENMKKINDRFNKLTKDQEHDHEDEETTEEGEESIEE